MRRDPLLLARLWRAEGAAGLLARAADHWAEARRRARFRRVALRDLPQVPVLQIAAGPPAPWLGGVPAQLGDRVAESARRGATALLYPMGGGMRLEVTAGGRWLAAWLPRSKALDAAAEGAAWTQAIGAAGRALRSRLFHVEGAAGLPHATFLDLARASPVLLSLHDFALFCPRPNLFDERRGGICGYCADEGTCEASLAASGRDDAASARGWRRRGGELLATCHCVVYPSEFLRRAHQSLFGQAGPRARVIAPGITLPLRGTAPWRAGRPDGCPRIAFLGGGGGHKGGPLFAAVVEEWSRRGLPPVAWEALGGGGPEQLRALRQLPGVTVRGYYRHGALPALLQRRRIALCLLLSQVPETFSLSLSEALAAGVPVLAISSGALAERLAAGGGMLLPEDAGVDEVIAALQRWLAGAEMAPPAASTRLAAEAAAAFDQLHAELLAELPPEPAAAPFQFPAERGDRLRQLAGDIERVAGGAARWARGRARVGELRSAWRGREASYALPALAMPGRGARPVVYLPALPWTFRFQRPQQLARGLVAAGHPVLYAEAFQRAYLLPRRRLDWTPSGVHRLALSLSGRPDPYREVLAAEVAEEVARTIAEGIEQRPLMVLAQLPFWAPVARRLREMLGVPLVYDRLDLHLGFPGVPPSLDRLEAELMAAADLVLASSPVLLDGCRAHARRAVLIANAVAFADFPAVQRRFGPPVTVGYVGALAPWFDAAAVSELAAARPQWQLRLAGRVESRQVHELRRRANVELLGEIPYADVPRFLAGLQALLVPFLDLPLTRAVDPVKLYEGLASGLPVVSRRLPAIELWSEPLVYSYGDAGLVAAVSRALDEDGPELALRRREQVAGQTWAARVAQVLDEVARLP